MTLRGVASAKGSWDIVCDASEIVGVLSEEACGGWLAEWVRLNKGHTFDHFDWYVRGLSLHEQHSSYYPFRRPWQVYYPLSFVCRPSDCQSRSSASDQKMGTLDSTFNPMMMYLFS